MIRQLIALFVIFAVVANISAGPVKVSHGKDFMPFNYFY